MGHPVHGLRRGGICLWQRHACGRSRPALPRVAHGV